VEARDKDLTEHERFSLLAPKGIAWEFGALQVHLFRDGKFSILPNFCHIVLNKDAEISTSTLSKGDDNNLNTMRGRSNFCMHFGVIIGKGEITWAWASDRDHVDRDLMEKRDEPYVLTGGKGEQDVRNSVINRRSDDNNDILVKDVTIAGFAYLAGQESKPIDGVAQQDVETILGWGVPFYWVEKGTVRKAQWSNGKVNPGRKIIEVSDVVANLWVPTPPIVEQMEACHLSTS
jgi:hypothetical protein